MSVGCKSGIECERGTEGCLCGTLDSCDEGLICSSQHCVSPNERALRIDAPGARVCDLVLVDGSEVIRGVAFGPSLHGARHQRGPRTMLALNSAGDVDLAGDQVVVHSVEGDGEGEAPYTVESAHCFDPLGRPMEGAVIAVAP